MYYRLTDDERIEPGTYKDFEEMMRSRNKMWRIVSEIGDVTVSTVFLGLDHNAGFGPPQLFETLTWKTVGSSRIYGAGNRAQTPEGARAMHETMCEMAEHGGLDFSADDD